MIPKSGNRFSEKIMLKQKVETLIRFNPIGSKSRSQMDEAALGHFRPTNPELPLAHFRLVPKVDVPPLASLRTRLSRRRFDRVAIAQALRNAIVDAAGVDHGIDQPHAD